MEHHLNLSQTPKYVDSTTTLLKYNPEEYILLNEKYNSLYRVMCS